MNHLYKAFKAWWAGSAIRQVMEKRYAWVARVDNWKVYLDFLYIYMLMLLYPHLIECRLYL